MGSQENIDRLERLNEQAQQGGGAKRIERQHELGKKTGALEELGPLVPGGGSGSPTLAEDDSSTC